MTDSSITIDRNGGMTFVGPDALELFHAATLRSALRLAKSGVQATRGLTTTKALAMCHRYTGKKYKRTEIDAAVADLTVWIETMKSAIPTTVEE